MKGQMSIEMMIYTALAGISMLASIIIVGAYEAEFGRYNAYYAYTEFGESIVVGIMGRAGSVSLYVPGGMCNSIVSGDALDTKYGSFYFPGKVTISNSILCSSGSVEANITYYNGSVSVW